MKKKIKTIINVVCWVVIVGVFCVVRIPTLFADSPQTKIAGNVETVTKDDIKTVTIGKKVWMAKNLNIETDGSWCYDSKPENCEKYGRLYTWEAAQNACPTGWHLPSKEEFDALIEFAGGADALKTKFGWKKGNGLDAYGFSALPAGSYSSIRKEFMNLGYRSDFWTSSPQGSLFSFIFGIGYYLHINDEQAFTNRSSRSDGFSVRCIKD